MDWLELFKDVGPGISVLAVLGILFVLREVHRAKKDLKTDFKEEGDALKEILTQHSVRDEVEHKEQWTAINQHDKRINEEKEERHKSELYVRDNFARTDALDKAIAAALAPFHVSISNLTQQITELRAELGTTKRRR